MSVRVENIVFYQFFGIDARALLGVLTRCAPQHSTKANLSGAKRDVSEPDPKRKLEDLDAKLTAYKRGQKVEKAHQEEHYSQANIAWRMVTEMVAGLGIGFGVGYGLDLLLGTLPFLMVVFSLLGVAAGINVMMRTAREVQASMSPGTAGTGTGPDKGDEDSARVTGADEGKKDGD